MRRAWSVAILCLLVLWGCKSLRKTPQLASLPVEHSLVRDQLVIYSDFTLPRDHRLVQELTAQRGDVAERLKLEPTDEPIHVYLFRSPESFQDFIKRHHPEFPLRRAFFVETDIRLAVYAHWGDRVAEDLRHEVAHGYLHAAITGLPLWLDEGLAEYFEVPRGYHGLHQQHIKELLEQIDQNDWQPNLPRLERLVSAGEMTQLDYAEAWAWVYFLLETQPQRRELLHRHLQSLRTDPETPPLSLGLRKLHVEPQRTLLDYLGSFR